MCFVLFLDKVSGLLDGTAEHHAEDHPEDHDDTDTDADPADDVQSGVEHLVDGSRTARGDEGLQSLLLGADIFGGINHRPCGTAAVQSKVDEAQRLLQRFLFGVFVVVVGLLIKLCDVLHHLVLIGETPDPSSHFHSEDDEQEDEEQSQHARRLFDGAAASQEAHDHHQSPRCNQDVHTSEED